MTICQHDLPSITIYFIPKVFVLYIYDIFVRRCYSSAIDCSLKFIHFQVRKADTVHINGSYINPAVHAEVRKT